MSAFLIEYHRLNGSVKCMKFGSLEEATLERLRRDKLNDDPDKEIVAVASDSEALLRKSHSRYFSAA
ncbi:MAG: hypothetical protein SOW59_01490 [Corynebacterium sp.]|nr:hypothetical protein [Corynebacterium sp.]